jgi:hypothetical protein
MICLLSYHTNILQCKLPLVRLIRGCLSIFYAGARVPGCLTGLCRAGFDKLEADHEATIISRFVRSMLLQRVSLFYGQRKVRNYNEQMFDSTIARTHNITIPRQDICDNKRSLTYE